MRHGKKDNHLSRKKGHRVALMRNLANALILHKRIKTTLAKAKALRVFIEPLVTKARLNTTHSRRVVFSYLQDKASIQELFGPIAVKVGDRPGGYVRVLRTGFRKGDGAEMAMIEFVDYNEVYQGGKKAGADAVAGGRKRSRRGGGKGSKSLEGTTAIVETITEAPQEVEAVEVEDAAEEVLAETQENLADDTAANNEAPAQEGTEDETK